jgi:hypothetical protein
MTIDNCYVWTVRGLIGCARRNVVRDLVSQGLVQEEKVLEWWLRSKKLVDKQVRKGFDSLLFLIGWTLWKERNAGVSTASACLVLKIQEGFIEWRLAGYKHLRPLLALL